MTTFSRAPRSRRCAAGSSTRVLNTAVVARTVRMRFTVSGLHVERVCSRVGRIKAPTDPEPRRKRHRKDVRTGFSPLTHCDRAHAPLRRRRQPHTRRPRGVERQSRRNDPPGARRRCNRSNGAAPTEFGPKIIAGVPTDRADAPSRSTTTPAKPIDADAGDPTSWDPRAATPTKRRLDFLGGLSARTA